MTTAIDHDTDLCTTVALTTGQLRKLADVLDATEPHTPLNVYVGITDMNYGATEAARVATVDNLAAALGLTAGQTKSEGGYWYHEAATGHRRFHLHIRTDIAAPAGRCACGATCTHSIPGGAR